jgi:hypothetical protein
MNYVIIIIIFLCFVFGYLFCFVLECMRCWSGKLMNIFEFRLFHYYCYYEIIVVSNRVEW